MPDSEEPYAFSGAVRTSAAPINTVKTRWPLISHRTSPIGLVLVPVYCGTEPIQPSFDSQFPAIMRHNLRLSSTCRTTYGATASAEANTVNRAHQMCSHFKHCHRVRTITFGTFGPIHRIGPSTDKFMIIPRGAVWRAAL